MSNTTSDLSTATPQPMLHATAAAAVRAREVSPSSTRVSKSRIVHISLGTDIGGMERLLIQFARFADRKRFELAFISLRERGKLASQLEDLQWPVQALGKQPGLRPGLVFRLARRLRRLNPDVVHTHNTAAFLYGTTAALLVGVPRIIHTRHGQRFQASSRETFAFRTLSRLAHRVVSVSEDGRQLTVAEGVRADRACLIRNGVDLAQFSYSGPRPGGPAMVVARLSAEKDIATLIQAMKHLSCQLDSQRQPLTLSIVGDGALRPQLESLTRSLELGATIRFLGERNEVPALLAEASMFVLPSLTEGISLTLLEAMARGLPVVATDVGGNPEVVEAGRTGLLVSARDPRALAQAMMKIHSDRELGLEMGRCGRQRVEAEFSVQAMVQAYERYYLEGAAK
jgi:sugar transferase (PEP-CTERM/EpsH1 system associated)